MTVVRCAPFLSLSLAPLLSTTQMVSVPLSDVVAVSLSVGRGRESCSGGAREERGKIGRQRTGALFLMIRLSLGVLEEVGGAAPVLLWKRAATLDDSCQVCAKEWVRCVCERVRVVSYLG